MPEPRLTIGIPHLDRTEMLRRALDSCLAQTEPVRVVVADQGRTEATADLLRSPGPYVGVEHWLSDADSLWANWRFAAYQCRTEFFAFLQDDDVIRPTYAARVISALDRFPDALHWQARLECARADGRSSWFAGNGPWLWMLHDESEEWEGAILPPTMYFTSWSLSPAVAFRVGSAFWSALDEQPGDCPIFLERSILASLGARGTFVGDRYLAGSWVQHGDTGTDGNESRRQWADQPRQTAELVDWLDGQMDSLGGEWRGLLATWARWMPATLIVGWVNQLGVTQAEGKPGRYTEEIKAIMVESLKGRLEVVRQPEEEAAWQPTPA